MTPTLPLPAADPREGFARETSALARSRARLGSMLAIAFLLLAIPADMQLSSDFRYPLLIRLVGCSLLVGLLALSTRQRGGLGSLALPLTTGIVIGSTIAALALLAMSRGDSYYAMPQAALIVLTVGTGSLLPIPARNLAVLVSVPLLLQAGLSVYLGTAANLPFLFVTGVGAIIAVIAGDRAFRVRRQEYDARMEMHRLLQARSEFVAMLSHDMKNPLGVALGLTEMLRDQPAENPAERRQQLDDLEISLRRALALAVNFLDAMRIQSGALVLHRESAPLNEIVERSLREQRTLAQVEGITVESRLGENLADLFLDKQMLHRAVTNLLGNALKFSPRDSRVRITTASRDGEIVLSFADQGPGIPPEGRAKLFQRYGQAALGARKDGSGLGLFIVKTITEAHGGRVSVTYPPEGGSVFEVALPIAVEDAGYSIP